MSGAFFFQPDEPEAVTEFTSPGTPLGIQSAQVAKDILARERYLSWPERDFLENVAAGYEFNTARMRKIAANFGVVL